MRNLTALAVLLAFGSAHAQATDRQITVAANSSSGTYAKMLGEIMKYCSDDNFNIIENKTVSGGARGNLEALINKKVDAAFLHADVFLAQQGNSDLAKLATLMAFWPEPVHIVALRESRTKKSGTFAFSKVVFSSTLDLRGYIVGAAGGGYFTGQIFQGTGAAGFGSVVEYPDGKTLLAALDNGDIAAALYVGAAPLPNIELLDKAKYKLLAVDEGLRGRLGVYKKVSINYNGLTIGTDTKTVAPLATLVTRKFSTLGKQAAQAHLRSCIQQHFAELKDNESKAWDDVDINDHGVLNNWLELGAPTSAPKRKP